MAYLFPMFSNPRASQIKSSKHCECITSSFSHSLLETSLSTESFGVFLIELAFHQFKSRQMIIKTSYFCHTFIKTSLEMFAYLCRVLSYPMASFRFMTCCFKWMSPCSIASMASQFGLQTSDWTQSCFMCAHPFTFSDS